MKKKETAVIRKYADLLHKTKPYVTYKTLKKVYKEASKNEKVEFLDQAKTYIMMNK